VSVDGRAGFVVTRHDAFQNAVTTGSMTLFVFERQRHEPFYNRDRRKRATSLSFVDGTSTGLV
jgi:hypothetical protein